jgi:adenylate cyclase
VNLASRIEQLNKTFGSQLLISDRVWQSVAEIVPRTIPIGDVQVKGREGSIQIYQVA